MQTATRIRKPKAVPVFDTTYAIDGSLWVPGCGKTERPSTTRSGRNIIYGWQPDTGDHRYLDLDANAVLPLIFDPAKDGTADDPLLPPRFTLWFVVRSPTDVVAALTSLAPDGTLTRWHSQFSFDQLRATNERALSHDFLNGERKVFATDPGITVISFFETGHATNLHCTIERRLQAIEIVQAASRAYRSLSPVELRLPPAHFDAARNLCAAVGGDPSRLVLLLELLNTTTTQPSPYNW